MNEIRDIALAALAQEAEKSPEITALAKNVEQQTQPPVDQVLVLAIQTAQQAVATAGVALDAAQRALALLLVHAEQARLVPAQSRPGLNDCPACGSSEIIDISTLGNRQFMCGNCSTTFLPNPGPGPRADPSA